MFESLATFLTLVWTQLVLLASLVTIIGNSATVGGCDAIIINVGVVIGAADDGGGIGVTITILVMLFLVCVASDNWQCWTVSCSCCC